MIDYYAYIFVSRRFENIFFIFARFQSHEANGATTPLFVSRIRPIGAGLSKDSDDRLVLLPHGRGFKTGNISSRLLRIVSGACERMKIYRPMPMPRPTPIGLAAMDS